MEDLTITDLFIRKMTICFFPFCDSNSNNPFKLQEYYHSFTYRKFWNMPIISTQPVAYLVHNESLEARTVVFQLVREEVKYFNSTRRLTTTKSDPRICHNHYLVILQTG